MTYYFKNNLVLVIFLCGIVTACSDKNKNNSAALEGSVEARIDSQKIKLDTLISELNREINENGQLEMVPFPVYNESDTIKYWAINGVPIRVSAALAYPDKIVWPTYFIRDGKIIHVRYRFWSIPEPSYATEHMLYISEDKTFYCMERSMNLEPEQTPYSLRSKPFSQCAEPPRNIEEEYKAYWTAIQAYLTRK